MGLSIPADAPAALMDAARLSLAARFTHLACSSVYFYDTFIVFKEEYRLIWLAQPSLFKYLAIAVRINGLFNAALTLAAFLGGLSFDSKGCLPLALAMVTFCSAGKSNPYFLLLEGCSDVICDCSLSQWSIRSRFAVSTFLSLSTRSSNKLNQVIELVLLRCTLSERVSSSSSHALFSSKPSVWLSLRVVSR